MPATFAHFTLFYEALAGLTGHDQLRIALKKYSQFGLLGTNSPDFPIGVIPTFVQPGAIWRSKNGRF